MPTSTRKATGATLSAPEHAEHLTALLINIQVLDEAVQDGDETCIRNRLGWLLRCWRARPAGLVDVRRDERHKGGFNA